MMRKKIVFLCIVFVLAIWIILIFADSQRLKNQTSAEKPIICIFEKATGEEIVYYGLGYSVHYELTNDSACSSTFYLLNIIVLWGWIE